MIVCQLAVLDTYVANVLDDDCVLDLIAYCKASFYLACFLRDIQFSLCFFSCNCCRSLDLLRIIASDCCRISCDCILDLTGINICLSHFISISVGYGCTRLKPKALAGQICMVVCKYTVRNIYVAHILDCDCVSDLFADRYAFCRISGLSDAQLCCSLFCSDSCGCLDLLRIIASDCCRISCDSILDLTGIYILLRHRIGVSEGCLFIRCQCESLTRQICVVIVELAVLDTYITSVLDDDSISDLVIDTYVLCRISGLSDTQFCSCFLCLNCCGSLDLFRSLAADCCRVSLDGVHDLARINICLCYFICISEFSLFARFKCKCLCRQISMIIVERAVLDCNIALVLDLYGVCYCVANCSI